MKYGRMKYPRIPRGPSILSQLRKVSSPDVFIAQENPAEWSITGDKAAPDLRSGYSRYLTGYRLEGYNYNSAPFVK